MNAFVSASAASIFTASLVAVSLTPSLREAPWLQPRSPLRLEAAEIAFLDKVTVSATATPANQAQEALSIFQQFGIVRVPHALTSADAASLAKEATRLQGSARQAFRQVSKGREAIFLGSGSQLSGTHSAAGSVIQQAIDGSLTSFDWRQFACELGAPHLGRAEVVTSLPGGAPQEWHYDGPSGVTLQVALCRIGLAQGPTEVCPRPISREYTDAMTRRERGSWWAASEEGEGSPSAGSVVQLTGALLHRPLYELDTMRYAAAWHALRPWVKQRKQAAAALGLGLQPPVVRLTADAGLLTIYDSRMLHRGGGNRGPSKRPILAAHMQEPRR